MVKYKTLGNGMGDGHTERYAYCRDAGANQSHWILDGQWHLEKNQTNDEFAQKIFSYFLAHCRAARGI